MRIGVDLDDVLVDFNGSFLEFHKRHYGSSLTRQETSTFDLWKPLGITREEAIERFYRFFHSEHHLLEPLPGAVAGVSSLHEKGHQLFLISSRTLDFENETKAWLERYFSGLFDEVVLLNHYSLLGQGIRGPSKAEIGLSYHLQVHIDDVSDTILQCAEGGIYGMLFDAPWNQHITILPANVSRVFSWEEIVSSLANFKNP